MPRRESLVILLLLLTLPAGCGRRNPPPAAPPTPGGPVVIPAGTTLAFRIAHAIDSSSAQPGQTFAGVVTRDVRDEKSQTVLSSGSPATLVLLREQDANGKEVFRLALASVMLNGDAFLVRNASERGNTEVPAARLGTFLGGIPGTLDPVNTPQGSQPFGQVTVSGERIWAPSGSLITFRLDQPLRLVGSRLEDKN